MKKKLNSILLVDDDSDCNFFHQRLINKMGCVEKIYIAKDGQEALEFLTSDEGGQNPSPDIIFLDINMPRMNGWEFIEEYTKLNEHEKAKIVLIMLTTSLNPDDVERSKKYKDVKGYRKKYLDKESMEKIIEEFFPEYM